MEQQPTAIGRYRIEAELGRGGWAVVLRAYDPKLKRSVALKYIPLLDETLRLRFDREVETAAALHHPRRVRRGV